MTRSSSAAGLPALRADNRNLALAGHSVLLIERGGRIKPCGGAIPPRLLADFDIPQSLLVAKARSAPHDRAFGQGG